MKRFNLIIVIQLPEHIVTTRYFIGNTKAQMSSSGLSGAKGIVRKMRQV